MDFAFLKKEIPDKVMRIIKESFVIAIISVIITIAQFFMSFISFGTFSTPAFILGFAAQARWQEHFEYTSFRADTGGLFGFLVVFLPGFFITLIAILAAKIIVKYLRQSRKSRG